MRFVRAAVVFLAPFVVASVLDLIAVQIAMAAFDLNGAEATVSPLLMICQLISASIVLAYFAVLTTAVDYRSRDSLLLLVPAVGLVYAAKWSWRYAATSEQRDWPRRDSKADRDGTASVLIEHA